MTKITRLYTDNAVLRVGAIDSGDETPESDESDPACTDSDTEHSEILMVEDDGLNVMAIQGLIA